MKHMRPFERGGASGSVAVRWLDAAHTVVLMTFAGEWRWMQFFWAVERLAHLLAAAAQPVDLIFDLRQGARVPQGVLQVGRLPWVWDNNLWPRALRHMVIVGGGAKVDSVLALRRRVAPHTLRYFQVAVDLEDALVKLATWDTGDPSEADPDG
jgi:hypothetical protein